jgi:hypothetical protein
VPFPLLSSHLLTADPFVFTRFPPLVASNKVFASAASSHKSSPEIPEGLNPEMLNPPIRIPPLIIIRIYLTDF